jgi:hypothetical protein
MQIACEGIAEIFFFLEIQFKKTLDIFATNINIVLPIIKDFRESLEFPVRRKVRPDLEFLAYPVAQILE